MATHLDEETAALLTGTTMDSEPDASSAAAWHNSYWRSRGVQSLQQRLFGLEGNDGLTLFSPMVHAGEDLGTAKRRYRLSQLGFCVAFVLGCVFLAPLLLAMRPGGVAVLVGPVRQGLAGAPSNGIVMDEVSGCGYSHQEGYVIPGFNTAVHPGQSADSCRKLCSLHGSCLAVEFATTREWGDTPLPVYSPGTCTFQSKAQGSQKADPGYTNVDLYVKQNPCGLQPGIPLVPAEQHGERCDNATAWCPPPQICGGSGYCQRPTGPSEMTFYMYRAQGIEDYPPENVNMADLAGVLWYLHREVVSSTPRKFHVTRILRFKMRMKNTQEFYDSHPKQFGPYVAFDSASAYGRTGIWSKYGFVVGCQLVDPGLFNYVPPSYIIPHCHPEDSPPCRSGKWYSLPGPCPEKKTIDKYPECFATWPGGRCPSAVVTGQQHCTYWPELAGEISLDELEGIEDYRTWWKSRNSLGDVLPNGNIEYNYTLDRGVNLNFWDGRHDKAACTGRMNAVADMFKRKFPDLPRTLPEPPCE